MIAVEASTCSTVTVPLLWLSRTVIPSLKLVRDGSGTHS